MEKVGRITMNRKRTIEFTIILVILLGTLISCTGVGRGSDAGAEWYVRDFESNSSTSGLEQIFETDDAVYFLTPREDGQIRFSDKNNKEWLPLCSKPNCMHEGDSCDSVLEGDAHGRMWLYGRSIYYCVSDSSAFETVPVLYRMRLDGSAHERLCSIPFPEDEAYTESGWSWLFHNKYVVISFRGGYVNESSEVSKGRKFYIVDLSDESFTAKPFDIHSPDERSSALGYVIAGRDNYLYSVILPNEDNVLYRTDLETGERIEIGVLPVVPELFDCTLEGDSLIMCDGWDTGAIYEFSLVTGETRVLAQADNRSQLWYRYYKGKVYGAHHGVEGAPFATGVYELDGTPIQIVDGSVYGKDIMMNYMLGDLAFGYDPSEGDQASEPPRYYLDLTKVGTDDFVWKEWGSGEP